MPPRGLSEPVLQPWLVVVLLSLLPSNPTSAARHSFFYCSNPVSALASHTPTARLWPWVTHALPMHCLIGLDRPHCRTLGWGHCTLVGVEVNVPRFLKKPPGTCCQREGGFPPPAQALCLCSRFWKFAENHTPRTWKICCPSLVFLFTQDYLCVLFSAHTSIEQSWVSRHSWITHLIIGDWSRSVSSRYGRIRFYSPWCVCKPNAKDGQSSLIPLIVESGFERMLIIQTHPVTPPASQNDSLKTLGTFQGKYHLFRNCQNPRLLRLLI